MFVTHVSAAALTITPTPASSPAPAKTGSSTNPTATEHTLQEINNLKDRIASRVAQMNLVEKRGIIGTVTDVKNTQITLTDKNGDTRYVDVDELTKFASPSAKGSFGISDITKGSILGILGRYNKDSKRILARFVDVLVNPRILSGAIKKIDTENFMFTLITPDQKEFLIDNQIITKTYIHTKDNNLIKSGFSKLQHAERVFVIGFPDKNDPNKIIASRILRFPDIKSNPLIPASKLQSQDANITPSTGSGVKLMPIISTKPKQ